MTNLNNCIVEFKFEFGKINSKTMDLKITNNNTVYLVTPDNHLLNTTNINITLPTTITLNFSGKNYNTDTIVDSAGKITNDIFVKFLSMSIDGFLVSEKFIHQSLKLITDNNQEITSSYIGFNGSVTIDLLENDVFSQYLLLNN